MVSVNANLDCGCTLVLLNSATDKHNVYDKSMGHFNLPHLSVVLMFVVWDVKIMENEQFNTGEVSLFAFM